MLRHELINKFADLFKNPRYLEIGVFNGDTFKNVSIDSKTGVDPYPQFEDNSFLGEEVDFYRIESDVYFAEIADIDRRFDLVFIDGLHTADQTLRDFTNSLHFTKDDAIIIIDDIGPRDWVEAMHLDTWLKVSPLAGGNHGWTGDVFKLLYLIQTFFPAIDLRIASESPNQAICWKKKKSRRVVAPFAARLADISSAQYPEYILSQKHFSSQSLNTIINDFSEDRSSNNF